MDTSVEAALCVHRSDGSIMKFIEYGSGLYYHDAAAAVQTNSNENVIDYSFVSTVANNRHSSHVAKLKERTRLEHFIERSGALLSNSSNKFLPRISCVTFCFKVSPDAKQTVVSR
jgi:hypothetical protein